MNIQDREVDKNCSHESEDLPEWHFEWKNMLITLNYINKRGPNWRNALNGIVLFWCPREGRCEQVEHRVNPTLSLSKRSGESPLNKKHPFIKRSVFEDFCNGAQERTRTSTPCGTATSRLRVYQFHHLGTPYVLRVYQPACRQAGFTTWACGVL